MAQVAEITRAEDRSADRLGETRGRIVSEAERLFREIGYQKTTVADIARALRMSPANVYRFFDSKKAINEAVAERMVGAVAATVAAIVERADESAVLRLREAVRTIHTLSTERFTANRRMHEMVEVAMSESWRVCEHFIATVDALLGRLIAQGARAGEFRVADPELAAQCVHVAIVRYTHPALIVQCADKTTPSLDEMVDFLLVGLGAGAPPDADPSPAGRHDS